MSNDFDDREEPTPGSAKPFFLWLGAILILSIGFNAWLDRQANPNQSPETFITESGAKEVVLERNGQGQYVTEGTINGESVTFIIDTGATRVSIPEAVADGISLERGRPLAVRTANGSSTAYTTRLDSVSIGGVNQKDVTASINPTFESKSVLLGMSFLGNVQFSQKGDELTLTQR